jgi:tetratricopeptide (TPR) repeat protein
VKSPLRLAAALSLAVVPLAGGCSVLSPKKPPGDLQAPLFDNYGNHHHEVTAKADLAQEFFDQGLVLAYGFNHAEAARSFREAARLDPECTMAWWGLALVLGPNINAPMSDDAVPEAYAAIRKAQALASKTSAKEWAYVEALAKRYSPAPVKDRAPLDVAYADAMRELSRRFPDDPDAATLFAEAIMVCHPWNYWQRDGNPQEWTPELLATIDSVLSRWPDHPGALHLHIHAVEASNDPGRALASADRLLDLVPGAGHLVHMPSHIYIRVGRYHQGTESNERAHRADESYVTQCRAQGMYPLAYVPHNVHFIWACATMEGRSEVAIKAACKTSVLADEKKMREPDFGTLQHFRTVPYLAYVRFGRWKDLLDELPPGDDLKYPKAMWHFGRGMAFAATGESAAADKEYSAVVAIANDPDMEKLKIWGTNSAKSVIAIARDVLAGEILLRQGRYDEAIARFASAIKVEDELAYQEPPDWYQPVRHSLGVALLLKGSAPEAEKVYRDDLKRHPENGWALFGLLQSLRAQGRMADALEVDARFKKAWEHADVTLTASRF